MEKVESEGLVVSVRFIIKLKRKCRICLGGVGSHRANDNVCGQLGYERSRITVARLYDVVISFARISEVWNRHRYEEGFHWQFAVDYSIADAVVLRCVANCACWKYRLGWADNGSVGRNRYPKVLELTIPDMFDRIGPFSGDDDLVVFYLVDFRQDLAGDLANIFSSFHLSPSAVRLEGLRVIDPHDRSW